MRQGDVKQMDAGFRDKVREGTDPVEIAELINAGLEARHQIGLFGRDFLTICASLVAQLVKKAPS